MELSKSQKLYERSQKLAPAGVHSPVRAFLSVGGTPIFFKSGKGAKLTDVDGNNYVDFCMSWGALPIGHAHSDVVSALKDQVDKGTHYGSPTEHDVKLAEEVLDALQPWDRIRFVNSGTEAVMTALRLARGITKKDLIVKIEGSYHGHVDSLLVAAGSGLVTQGLSTSEGIPVDFAKNTLVVPYGNLEALQKAFEEHGKNIAAIIVEPVLANNGLFEHEPEYLRQCRHLCDENCSLLIFDEVITGFRLGLGGAKSTYDVNPDIGTYGKVIGGGMPIGAVAGPAKYMDQLAPTGPIYQAGTLSGNPLAMVCGYKTLTTMKNKKFYSHIKDLGRYFDQRMNELIERRPELKLSFRRIDSIFWLTFGRDSQPLSPSEIDKSCAENYKSIYHHLLNKGIYLAPSAYEVAFLSLAHQYEHVDALVKAIESYEL